jgi:hypothetical protein
MHEMLKPVFTSFSHICNTTKSWRVRSNATYRDRSVSAHAGGGGAHGTMGHAEGRTQAQTHFLNLQLYVNSVFTFCWNINDEFCGRYCDTDDLVQLASNYEIRMSIRK